MKKARPPIVTVLGHVDHGKTTLLDAIRKTNVASREAGGITQGIGASKINTSEGEITFVDTPGHAAFAKMRARGARVADIAVLVVAADDGVMPQTREAIGYVKENQIPMIVALTKVDLPSSNVEKTRGQLEQEEIFFEGRGGATPSVEVSAKKGSGVAELIETIHLLAGVTGFTADPDAPLSAFVIETNKDKRGTLVSAIVKDGTVRVGDEISAGDVSVKIKGLFNENNKPIKSALPSDPVLILGFSQTPDVGAEITDKKEVRAQRYIQVAQKVKVEKDQLPVILKAKSAGSIEPISLSLPKDVVVLHASVGEVTESDVFLAKTAGAIVVSFESKVPSSVKRLAETEGVEVTEFKVIYDIVKYLEERLAKGKVDVLGKAEILAEFPFNKTRVAGVKVLEGRISKSDRIILMRAGSELGATKIASMRRAKNELNEAKAGEECGIVMAPLLPFAKNDILVATK